MSQNVLQRIRAWLVSECKPCHGEWVIEELVVEAERKPDLHLKLTCPVCSREILTAVWLMKEKLNESNS